MLFHGRGGLQASDEKAAELWLAAAKTGHVKAMYSCGIACREGRGLPQSTEEAKKWLRKASAGGLQPATAALFDMENGAADG